MKKPPAKTPFMKPPTSFADQVQRLIGRGLSVPDIALAEHYLAQLNYYRFAAYCLPFEQNHATYTFKANTQFDDVLNLYIFDRELRLLLLDAIERVEVSLRTQMAYHLSHNHNTAHPHLKPDLFFNPIIYGVSISKLDNDVRSSKEEFIKHLSQKYEEFLPPIWAVVELMTMGHLSKWFSNIKARNDRQAISRIYGLDEKILTSFCHHLTPIRNYCAHHARLWNRDFTVLMTLPIKGRAELINGLNTPVSNQQPNRKIYNTLVMLIYLMDVINPNHHWKQRLINLLGGHQIDVSRMGFPSDWKNRDIWK